ncbi:MAG: ankyrin repeat domain-containing protein [bacterium]|nr:ankyrin repeat domain-containing protein [bacterium]
MRELRILPPEKARAKARAKVAEFQADKRKRKLEGKLESRAGTAKVGNRKWIPLGKMVVLKEDKVAVKLSRIVDGEASFVVYDTWKDDNLSGSDYAHYPEGVGFIIGKTAVGVTKIEPNGVEIEVKVLERDETGPQEQKKLNDELLYRAGQKSSVLSIMRLLEAGADVNAKGFEGWTPLMKAADGGSEEICQALIDAGADLDHKDEFGSTALAIATRENNAGAAVLLAKAEKGGDLE